MTRAQNDMEKALQAFMRMLAGDDPAAMMREIEVAKGYRVVEVGTEKWLPRADWHRRDVFSTDGHVVRIVALKARHPRTGAFNRLLAGIVAANLTPVVICPMDDMELILRRWGWRHREVGFDFDTHEDQWWPARHWRPRTEASASAGTETPTRASTAAGGPDSQQGGHNGPIH
jgi:hypothetical protein